MFDLVRECAIEAKNYLLATVLPSVDGECEMEMTGFYSRVTNDVIASCAFGLKINSLVDRNNEFFETGCQLQHLNSIKSFTKIWFLRSVPWLATKLHIQFVDAHIRKVFSNLVLQNIETRRTNKIVRPDLIDLLMRTKQSKSNEINDTAVQWSDEEIISQAFVFFLAGFDTTMWVLIATTYELAQNQDIQKRLIDEIDTKIDKINDKMVTYEDINKLKYLDMVICEVLRVHSPAVLIDRLCQ